MAMFAAIAGAALSFAGQMKAADAAKKSAQAQQQAKQYEAAQMQQQATQEVATAQRAALEERARAKKVAGRAAAVISASGGGITDPSLQNLIADIQGEGAYRAGVKMYEGEDAARRLRMGAEARQFEGEVALQQGEEKAQAARIGAVGSAASSFGSMGSMSRFWSQPTYKTGGYTGSQWSDGQ